MRRSWRGGLRRGEFMIANQLKFRASRAELWSDAIEIRLWSERGDAVGIPSPLTFTLLTPEQRDAHRLEPSFAMSRDSAQQLMDELWNVGLRPTEGTGSAGSLAATERHLADMRALVFKTEGHK